MRRTRTNRKMLVKRLDMVFSQFIRQRDRFCVQCGAKENLTCGHLFSRVSYSTRWDELNCHCQCAGCNLRHEYNPHNFTAWFLRKFGLGKYELLLVRHNKISKFANPDLELLISHYEDRLDELVRKRFGKCS